MKPGPRTVLLLAAVSGLGACGLIAGTEDKTLDPSLCYDSALGMDVACDAGTKGGGGMSAGASSSGGAVASNSSTAASSAMASTTSAAGSSSVASSTSGASSVSAGGASSASAGGASTGSAGGTSSASAGGASTASTSGTSSASAGGATGAGGSDAGVLCVPANCPSGPNGAAICTAGECGFQCTGGFFDCDGQIGCEASAPAVPVAPSLLAPARGVYTGSLFAPSSQNTLRPTLVWSAVTSTCGAVSYHVELDNSCIPGSLKTCAFDSPEIDVQGVTGASYQPTANLPVSSSKPVGALYAWRVQACDASKRCSPWSDVAYLQVGRVREDLDGDGYADLGIQSNVGLEAFSGSGQFDLMKMTTVATGASLAANKSSYLGDVNGDGYGDMATQIAYNPSSGLAPYILLGGPDLTALQTVTLTKSAGGSSTLLNVRPAGDWNGDGFADFVIQWNYNTSELRVFNGAATLPNTPALTIPATTTTYAIRDSGVIGDVNADGYEDIAMIVNLDTAVVMRIFTGGTNPTATATATVDLHDVPYTAGPEQGRVHAAGDLNRDGIPDAVMAIQGYGFFWYLGNTTLSTSYSGFVADTSTFTITGGFDLNGDEIGDFIVGRDMLVPLVYRGVDQKTSGVPLPVPNGGSHLTSCRKLSAADDDGDGRADITCGNTWAGSDGTFDPRTVNIFSPIPNHNVTKEITE